MIVLHYVLLVYSTITTGEQKKWGHQLGNSHILNYFSGGSFLFGYLLWN